MLPLLIAGAIWGYNAVKIAQLANRNNRLKKRDSDEEDTEKNLNLYNNCTFKHEDKRTYNHFQNCTFNIYLTGGRNEEHIKGKGRGESAWFPEMAEQAGENLRKRKSFMPDSLED